MSKTIFNFVSVDTNVKEIAECSDQYASLKKAGTDKEVNHNTDFWDKFVFADCA